jgi:hypothetical protein
MLGFSETAERVRREMAEKNVTYASCVVCMQKQYALALLLTGCSRSCSLTASQEVMLWTSTLPYPVDQKLLLSSCVFSIIIYM